MRLKTISAEKKFLVDNIFATNSKFQFFFQRKFSIGCFILVATQKNGKRLKNCEHQNMHRVILVMTQFLISDSKRRQKKDKRRTQVGILSWWYTAHSDGHKTPGAGRSRQGGHASEVTVTTWRQKKRLLFHQGTALTLYWLMYYIFPSILRWQNSCRTSIFTCFHLMKIFREGWISQGIISLLMGVGN